LQECSTAQACLTSASLLPQIHHSQQTLGPQLRMMFVVLFQFNGAKISFAPTKKSAGSHSEGSSFQHHLVFRLLYHSDLDCVSKNTYASQRIGTKMRFLEATIDNFF
jgi:hypothetical protein